MWGVQNMQCWRFSWRWSSLIRFLSFAWQGAERESVCVVCAIFCLYRRIRLIPSLEFFSGDFYFGILFTHLPHVPSPCSGPIPLSLKHEFIAVPRTYVTDSHRSLRSYSATIMHCRLSSTRPVGRPFRYLWDPPIAHTTHIVFCLRCPDPRYLVVCTAVIAGRNSCALITQQV